MHVRLTAADDGLDGVDEIMDVDHGWNNEEVLVGRVGGDGRQKLSVNERTNAHDHYPDVLLSSRPRLLQR